MKKEIKRKIKIASRLATALLTTTFIVLSATAKMKKGNTVYDDEPEQKNPMEGKRVRFIEDENDQENADGVKGHLVETEGTVKERTNYDRYIKRGIDIILSFGGLVILSPVYAAIALAIKIDDPGPILFTQKRVGQNKQYFKLHKFRSMKMSTPHDVPTHMLDNPDQYITRVGRFLRKSSLDELPQIWDIFIGNMSIIGPRPALWNQDCLTSLRDQYGANDVKPGLTGWAQINGRDELELDVKAQLDGEYVEKQSLLFDVKCFLKTIQSVVRSDGIVEGRTGKMSDNSEKVRILVISQYYYPEPFKIHEICEEFVKRGHQVTVITGRPNYPDGILFEGYANKNKMDEMINGVRVIRTNIPVRGNNPISLIKNYFSYPIYAQNAINSLNEEYDVVFVYQLSPAFMIKPALYYKRKFNKKVYVYCLDLWPESLKILGINESNLIYKIIGKFCNKLYQSCDFISVTSPYFIEYLNKKNGVDIHKINCIPQHGEDLFLQVEPYKHQDKLNIVFAGNIGKAQDFNCLVKAVSFLTSSYKNKLKITIIGSGSFETEFKQLVKKENLNDIFIFTGRKKIGELVEYYNDASLFLLSLEKDSHIGKTIPSKLQTYMAAGRGIIGSIDGTAADIINHSNAGIVCEAGNSYELSKIIKKMIDADFATIENYSKNSRDYFLNNFTIHKYVDKVIEKMEDLK